MEMGRRGKKKKKKNVGGGLRRTDERHGDYRGQ